MAEVEFRTAGELESWLKDKPADWARVIAVREALRALPALRHVPSSWLSGYRLFTIRALAISWAACCIPAHDMGAAANAAAVAANAAANAAENAAANAAAHASNAAAYAASNAAANAAYAAAAAAYAAYAVATAHNAAAAAAAANAAYAAAYASNTAINTDVDWLLAQSGNPNAAQRLSCEPLWPTDEPSGWRDGWDELSQQLRKLDPHYQVWTDWLERRIAGREAAFDIPGDHFRTEDKAILINLAEATDEDFWGKGHEFVNSELTRWLEEARARAASNLVPLTTPPALPAQNPNAITFRAVAGDKIDIDSAALGRQVKTDGGAQERYAEAISEARLWLDRCQSSNAGARLTRLLENYLAAAGERLETASHALLVQRGERLRQELARYEAADNMLPPIADDLLLDGMGWRSAHNMMLGLDPVLLAADVAMLGPDRKPGLIPPQEIIALARDADAKDLLEEGVAEIVIEAAQLAPDPPDQTDRRTVWSIETAQNLIIEAFAIALNYPKTAAGAALVGTALYAALGVGGIGAISIMGSIRAAEYLVVHQGWILQRLGNTPTWQALIAELADWLKRVTPFNPK